MSYLEPLASISSCWTMVSKTEESFQLKFHVHLDAFHKDFCLVCLNILLLLIMINWNDIIYSS